MRIGGEGERVSHRTKSCLMQSPKGPIPQPPLGLYSHRDHFREDRCEKKWYLTFIFLLGYWDT